MQRPGLGDLPGRGAARGWQSDLRREGNRRKDHAWTHSRHDPRQGQFALVRQIPTRLSSSALACTVAGRHPTESTPEGLARPRNSCARRWGLVLTGERKTSRAGRPSSSAPGIKIAGGGGGVVIGGRENRKTPGPCASWLVTLSLQSRSAVSEGEALRFEDLRL